MGQQNLNPNLEKGWDFSFGTNFGVKFIGPRDRGWQKHKAVRLFVSVVSHLLWNPDLEK